MSHWYTMAWYVDRDRSSSVGRHLFCSGSVGRPFVGSTATRLARGHPHGDYFVYHPLSWVLRENLRHCRVVWGCISPVPPRFRFL